jgi:hypothetical protein
MTCYLGHSEEELEGRDFIYSYELGTALKACGRATSFWTDELDRQPLHTHTIAEEFQHYCVPCFIANALDFLEKHDEELEEWWDAPDYGYRALEIPELCTCDPNEVIQSEDQVRETIMYLNALLLHVERIRQEQPNVLPF